MTSRLADNIALIGRARSGKDSIAARLVGAHGYTRVAFADPLKDAALRLDPIVTYERAGGGYLPTYLSRAVSWHGWEYAKDRFPEVRRTLQNLGQSIRDVHPNFWVNLAMDTVDSIAGPVVVTDCRYRNEVEALKARRFRIVRVVRPPHGGELTGHQHVSETELDDFRQDATAYNSGTLHQLDQRADQLAR